MEGKQKKENYIFNYFLILILILIDQITKLLFFNIKINSKTCNFICINSFKNFGSGFNLFSNFLIYKFLIIIFSIIFLIILIYNSKYFFKNKILENLFIFTLAGIFGNLIDRIFFGYVRDFIEIKYLFIFNLADLFLSIAFILFLFYTFNEYKNLKNR